jgi:hypothetical protein
MSRKLQQKRPEQCPGLFCCNPAVIAFAEDPWALRHRLSTVLLKLIIQLGLERRMTIMIVSSGLVVLSPVT